MGKELLTDLKYVIFKNWLGTRPKMETNEPNVYPTILGGAKKWHFERPNLGTDSKNLAKH